MTYPKLYSRDSSGGIRVWWLEQEGNAYSSHYGVEGGKIVSTEPIYCEAKNVGKANESDAVSQCTTEIKALYKKQKKQNYFESIDDIDDAWKEPQLCKLYKDYADKVDWSQGQYVDEKINGICCLITKNGARSRKNEIFYTVPHILEELELFFKKNPNGYLHGELVRKGCLNQLNKTVEIISVGRKEKDITPELLRLSEQEIIFIYYDGYGFANLTDASDFQTRRDVLQIELSNCNYCQPVNYIVAENEEQMKEFADNYISTNGEGVVLKDPRMCYVHKRSKNCLKYKKSESAEFKVISLESGSGNWAGCAKFAWCELPNGLKDKKFKTNIKGTQEELREALKNKDKWVGKMITVDYQELSPYNTPLIPYTDLIIRDYE